MRIIYIHQYFALPSSNGGTRSYDLAKQFIARGYKVIIVTTNSFLKNLHEFSEGWTIMEYEGLELHVLKLEYSNTMSFTKRISTFAKFFVQASLHLLKIKCDIVLATSTPITIAIPAIIKRFVHGTPYIFEVRDVWPEVPIAMGVIKNKMAAKLLYDFEQVIYKKSAHIVALSQDMKTSITSRNKQASLKLSVIPNISEIDRFSSFSENEIILPSLLGYKPEKVVLYAGTLGMVNGLQYMLKLAEQAYLIDSSIKFVIFGEGMEKIDLVEYARSKSLLQDNVYFFDPISKAELPQIYYESTVASSFVIPVPELWANSANKFFDSLAAGKPIVINHRGWQADVIEKENVGFVLDYRIENIQQESIRFCRYLNDDRLIAMQGFNAKRLAENDYSLAIASDKYTEILEDVVS